MTMRLPSCFWYSVTHWIVRFVNSVRFNILLKLISMYGILWFVHNLLIMLMMLFIHEDCILGLVIDSMYQNHSAWYCTYIRKWWKGQINISRNYSWYCKICKKIYKKYILEYIVKKWYQVILVWGFSIYQDWGMEETFKNGITESATSWQKCSFFLFIFDLS